MKYKIILWGIKNVFIRTINFQAAVASEYDSVVFNLCTHDSGIINERGC